jgi:hypothetical protein
MMENEQVCLPDCSLLLLLSEFETWFEPQSNQLSCSFNVGLDLVE